jgi:hypothetical protein
MKLMIYDTSLEPTPINWAKSCPNSHNPNRGSNGENIYWYYSSVKATVPTIDIGKAIDAWYSEVSLVKTFPTTYGGSGSIGHYTQVVWALSDRLACGTSVCLKSSTYTTTVVCNYGPPGNYIGKPIYSTGDPCSKCESGFSCSQSYPGKILS